MFFLGCLPLWGREGVTLIAFFKRMKSERISTEPKFPKMSGIEKTSRYGVSSPNPYASFGTLISNRAALPGSPDSIIESPVMLRISAAR